MTTAGARFDEATARAVLLVRAFDTAPPPQPQWTPEDQAWATRVARGSLPPTPGPARALAERARHALERLQARDAGVAAALRPRRWRAGAALAAVLLGLAAGSAVDAVGSSGQVDLLAPPLAAVLLWNAVVYLGLAVRLPLQRRASRAAAWVGRWLDRPQRGTSAPLRAFRAAWLRTAAPLSWARGAALLHIAAAALAVGLVGGLYLRGLVFDYRAGWQSTFLDADAVHAALSVVLAPASAVTGIAVPDAGQLGALRTGPAGAGAGAPNAPSAISDPRPPSAPTAQTAPSTTPATPAPVLPAAPAGPVGPAVPGAPDGPAVPVGPVGPMGPVGPVASVDAPAPAPATATATAVDSAAPWIHLYAATLGLFVVLPRLLLALAAAAQAAWRARRLALPLTDPDLQRLLQQLTGRAAVVQVLPTAGAPSPDTVLRLAEWFGAGFGAEAQLHFAEPQAADAERPPPSLPEGATLRAVLADLATTPEDELHGRLLDALAQQAPAVPRLLLADAAAFGDRFGALPERMAERRAAWQRLADAHGARFADVDLARPDMAAAPAALGAAGAVATASAAPSSTAAAARSLPAAGR